MCFVTDPARQVSPFLARHDRCRRHDTACPIDRRHLPGDTTGVDRSRARCSGACDACRQRPAGAWLCFGCHRLGDPPRCRRPFQWQGSTESCRVRTGASRCATRDSQGTRRRWNEVGVLHLGFVPGNGAARIGGLEHRRRLKIINGKFRRPEIRRWIVRRARTSSFRSFPSRRYPSRGGRLRRATAVTG